MFFVIMKMLMKFLFPGPVNRDPDWNLFEKLRETNEKHRELLRIRDKEIQDKISEAETVRTITN